MVAAASICYDRVARASGSSAHIIYLYNNNITTAAATIIIIIRRERCNKRSCACIIVVLYVLYICVLYRYRRIVRVRTNVATVEVAVASRRVQSQR